MGIICYWENSNQTIFHWTFDANWSWEDYYALRDDANIEITSNDHMVDVIVDMQESDIVSNAIDYDSSVRRSSNIGMTVIVSRRLLFHPYSKVFRYIFAGEDQSNIYTVATLEEAYALLGAKQPV